MRFYEFLIVAMQKARSLVEVKIWWPLSLFSQCHLCIAFQWDINTYQYCFTRRQHYGVKQTSWQRFLFSICFCCFVTAYVQKVLIVVKVC